MRVLMIAPQFHPLVGGYERACERLSITLAALGHDVTVMSEQRDLSWPRHETFQGVELRRWWCIYLPGLHVVTSLLGLVSNLLWRGRRYEVWHVHQYGVHAALAVVLGRLLRRPVVLKLTNSSNQGLVRTLAQSRLPGLMAYLHRRVDAVVALTRETAAEAEAFGIPKVRIHLLSNGVNIEIFRPRDEQERNALKDKLGLGAKRVVIFVGRFAEAKNVEGLLKAWSLTNGQMRADWQLLLVGDGPLMHAAEQLSKEYFIADTVGFVGQQKNIEEWMGAAEIYISTSWHEGLSNALLEAMATGLPVVATRVSGVAEIVEANDAGIAVEIGDMDGVASGLMVLANDSNMRNICGNTSRRAIEDNYSVNSVAARTVRIYCSLLAR